MKRTFDQTGSWYKGNLHTHTTLSDGQASPAAVASTYRSAGYDFLAITDHWRYGVHAGLQANDFLIFPGVEFDTPIAPPEGLDNHIVAIGDPALTPYADGETFAALREEFRADSTRIIPHMAQSGHLCIYAHPRWSHVQQPTLLKHAGCIGMEIYNHDCRVIHGCGNSETHFEQLLWNGCRPYCFAVDDAHHLDHCGGGFIMVKTADFSHAGILSAIRAGSFYASNGPLIHDFYVDGDRVVVQCSACASVVLQGDELQGQCVTNAAGRLYGAHFTLHSPQKYVWAHCYDADGRTAWTQPIYLD